MITETKITLFEKIFMPLGAFVVGWNLTEWNTVIALAVGASTFLMILPKVYINWRTAIARKDFTLLEKSKGDEQDKK